MKKLIRRIKIRKLITTRREAKTACVTASYVMLSDSQYDYMRLSLGGWWINAWNRHRCFDSGNSMTCKF